MANPGPRSFLNVRTPGQKCVRIRTNYNEIPKSPSGFSTEIREWHSTSELEKPRSDSASTCGRMKKTSSLFDVLKSFLGISDDADSSDGAPSPSQWSTISMSSKYLDGQRLIQKKRNMTASAERIASDGLSSESAASLSVFHKTRQALNERTEKLGEVENQTHELRSGAQGFANNMRLLLKKKEAENREKQQRSLAYRLFKKKKKKSKLKSGNRIKKTEEQLLDENSHEENNPEELRVSPNHKEHPPQPHHDPEIKAESSQILGQHQEERLSLSAKIFRKTDLARKSLPLSLNLNAKAKTEQKNRSSEAVLASPEDETIKSKSSGGTIESNELDDQDDLENPEMKKHEGGRLAAMRNAFRKFTHKKN